MSDMSDFNAKIIDEFRANGGTAGPPFDAAPLLLLHHTGARSAKPYVTPLVYRRDGDAYVIFASKAGAPTNPDWYHNLRAHSEVLIEVGTDTLAVTAAEVPEPDRTRLYDDQAADMPNFADYRTSAGDRVIPVLALTPSS